MDRSASRSAARLAAPVLLALLVSGCSGKTATSTGASTTAASTTTVAPTTTTIPPLNAKELAWLKALSGMRTKVEKSFEARGSGRVTRAMMVESSNQLAAWSRQLRRMGAPSARLQPVYTLVRKVIRTYDKGAKCFATAAGAVSASGAVVGGTPEERIAKEALDCADAAEGDGTNLLYKADAKGKELKAKYG
ncbi:MAG TPA: hypothetical protein VFA46_18900 [Actinomycetes bacterium]|jgi:hypothetical protein|nr:hypothetical protein [Actinomycetes bacterium]